MIADLVPWLAIVLLTGVLVVIAARPLA